jgi:hypothetical protein
MFKITTYSDSDFSGVDALWGEAFPDDNAWNAAELSIPRARFLPGAWIRS